MAAPSEEPTGSAPIASASGRGVQTDTGCVLVTRCPHCHGNQPFHLVECVAGPSIFTSLINALVGVDDDAYYLCCSACSYDILVDNDEVHLLRDLSQQLSAVTAGDLDSDSYCAAVRDCEADAIQQLLTAAETRTCSGCGEEVPPSFGVCWNCNTEIAEGADDDWANHCPPSIVPQADPFFGRGLLDTRVRPTTPSADSGNAEEQEGDEDAAGHM
jgi:hypothetical protein